MPNLKQAHIAIALAISCISAPAVLAQSKKGRQPDAPAAIPDSQKKIVAVLEPAGAANVTDMNKEIARGTLEDYISRSLEYKVVDRSSTDQILEELGYQRQSGMIPDGDAKKLGQQLGADFVAVSRILKEGGQANITIAIINVESGVKKARNGFLKSDDNEAIADQFEKLAADLLGIKTKAEEKAPPPEPPKKPNPLIPIITRVFEEPINDLKSVGSNTLLQGNVQGTRVRYEVRLDDDGVSVRVRFNAKGVDSKQTNGHNHIHIKWALDGSANIKGADDQFISLQINTIRDVTLYARDPSQPVKLGRFLVKELGYAGW